MALEFKNNTFVHQFFHTTWVPWIYEFFDVLILVSFLNLARGYENMNDHLF